MDNKLKFNLVDRLMIGFDRSLRTVFGKPASTGRLNPAENYPEQPLNESEQNKSIGLMRVDHAGEVSAQALYQGQALVARDENIQASLLQSAQEENDHLLWCESRLDDLGGHKSYLNAVWYLGSLTTGVVAGLAGDRWSLGFVVETENQVAKHLDEHLTRISPNDQKSRAILEQMKEDELHHATIALESGAQELPEIIKKLMALQSKVMTNFAYWI